ncbi:hypothetical protein ACFX12_025917 [Malus domestica]
MVVAVVVFQNLQTATAIFVIIQVQQLQLQFNGRSMRMQQQLLYNYRYKIIFVIFFFFLVLLGMNLFPPVMLVAVVGRDRELEGGALREGVKLSIPIDEVRGRENEVWNERAREEERDEERSEWGAAHSTRERWSGDAFIFCLLFPHTAAEKPLWIVLFLSLHFL